MRKIGSVLYDVPPLVVNPVVALIFGTHEAIVLQQLHYWLEHKKRKKDKKSFIEGHYWVHNTVAEWHKQFIFISEATIKRVFKKLKDKKIILVEQFNKSKWDHKNFYTIDYKVLSQYFGAFEKKEDCEEIKMTPSNEHLKDTSEEIKMTPSEEIKMTPSEEIKMTPSFNTETTPEINPETTTTTEGISKEIPCRGSCSDQGKAKPALGEEEKSSALENLYKTTAGARSNIEQLSTGYFGSFYPEAQAFFDNMSMVSSSQLMRTMEKVTQQYSVDVVSSVIRSFQQKRDLGEMQYYNPTYFFKALEEEVEMQHVRAKLKDFCLEYFGAGETALEVYDFYKNVLKSKQDSKSAKSEKGVPLHERRIKSIKFLAEEYGLQFFLKVLRSYKESYSSGDLAYEPTISRFTKYLQTYFQNTSKNKSYTADTKDTSEKPITAKTVVLIPYKRVENEYEPSAEIYNWSFQCSCGAVSRITDDFGVEIEICGGCTASIDLNATRKNFNSLLRTCECGTTLFPKDTKCFSPSCGLPFDIEKAISKLEQTLKNNGGQKKDEHGANVRVCQDEGHRSTQQDC